MGEEGQSGRPVVIGVVGCARLEELGLPWHASRRMADQRRVTNVIVRGGEKGATSIKEVGHS